MVKIANGVVKYAPLYVHSFNLLQPHKRADTERFTTYSDPSMLTKTADKLRYHRYKKALLQRDVARCAGIGRCTYNSYEQNQRGYYPLEVLEKIAEVLEVGIVELLDEYNLFLYNGQGRQIRMLRDHMGLTQYQFGKLYGVSAGAVKQWENDKVRVSKATWEKLLK